MNMRTYWDHVYTSRSVQEVSWYQPHAEQSLALIKRIAAGRPSRVIDVGGGASTLVDDLLEQESFDVSVLDLSAAVLSVARNRLGAQACRVQWLAGDITQLELPAQAYDLWHDRAVFHFLTKPAQRAAYVAQVCHAVRPGGHVIVATFASDGPTRCSGLPVLRYSPDKLHDEFGGAFELIESMEETHRTPGGVIQPFVYCHCVMHEDGQDCAAGVAAQSHNAASLYAAIDVLTGNNNEAYYPALGARSTSCACSDAIGGQEILPVCAWQAHTSLDSATSMRPKSAIFSRTS